MAELHIKGEEGVVVVEGGTKVVEGPFKDQALAEAAALARKKLLEQQGTPASAEKIEVKQQLFG